MKLNKIKPETHTLLKEIGFDIIECTCGGYPECICTDWNVPTQALVQMWLREIHGINIEPWCNASGWAWELEKTNGTHISIMDIDGNVTGTNPESGMFATYEQALEAGIIECIRILKEGSCG